MKKETVKKLSIAFTIIGGAVVLGKITKKAYSDFYKNRLDPNSKENKNNNNDDIDWSNCNG